MTRPPSGAGPGRRRFLALSGTAGLALVAGCADRLPVVGEQRETIDGDALGSLAGDAPSVPRTLPVDVGASVVDEHRAAARAKLAAVPAPFDEEAIPNGVIRERLNDRYESVRESLRRADDGPTPYTRLGGAKRARIEAHEVQAAWRAIDSDLTRSDLEAEVPPIRDAVEAFVAEWAYVGDDPVRAVVVHDQLEDAIRDAQNRTSIRPGEFSAAESRALKLGAIASALESARVDVAVASALFERFRESLDGSSDLRSRFERVREELRSRARTAAESVPRERVDDPTSLVDRDIDRTAGIEALADLGRDARWRVEDDDNENDGPVLATGLLVVPRAIAYVRAYESLRERIEGGDDVAVESAEDVATIRADAVAAVEAAQETERGRLLVQSALPRYADRIRRVDDAFSRRSGRIQPGSVRHDVAEYVAVAEVCRALPDASAEVAAALRG
ncbi:hypothetical protein DVK02_09230 [Halobellus sp. Atlit-31R]|nr:hypothetical protein DVK02_09230 [Halobellus sp. Atlit-31R]